MRASSSSPLRRIIKSVAVAMALFPVVLFIFIKKSHAQEYVLAKEEPVLRGRAPASLMPSDDIGALPMEQELWIDRVIVEDDDGILSSIQNDFKRWETTDEYARVWNLSSTGLFITPTDEQRKSYLSKRLLRYVDKRISGEVKRAEEGSTLHSVGQVQEALTPNTTVEVSQFLKFRFRGRILQGEARMLIENPWVDCTTKVDYKGNLELNIGRSFASVGMRAEVMYNVTDDRFETFVDKSITDRISSRFSVIHDDETRVNHGEPDAVLKFVYSAPF